MNRLLHGHLSLHHLEGYGSSFYHSSPPAPHLSRPGHLTVVWSLAPLGCRVPNVSGFFSYQAAATFRKIKQLMCSVLYIGLPMDREKPIPTKDVWDIPFLSIMGDHSTHQPQASSSPQGILDRACPRGRPLRAHRACGSERQWRPAEKTCLMIHPGHPMASNDPKHENTFSSAEASWQQAPIRHRPSRSQSRRRQPPSLSLRSPRPNGSAESSDSSHARGKTLRASPAWEATLPTDPPASPKVHEAKPWALRNRRPPPAWSGHESLIHSHRRGGLEGTAKPNMPSKRSVQGCTAY